MFTHDDEESLLGGSQGGKKGGGYVELDDLHVNANPLDDDDAMLLLPSHKQDFASTKERIHELLRTLRHPLPRYRPKDDDDEEEGDRIVLSGHLFRERTLGLGHWKLQWAVLTLNASLGTLALHYQNPKEESGQSILPSIFKKKGTEIGTIPFTFISTAPFTKHEKELTSIDFEKHHNGGTVSRNYIKVYSQQRLYTFAARDDEEFEYWMTPIKDILRSCLGDEEYERREAASQELEPLLRQRYYKRLTEAQEVLRSLAISGFFDSGIRTGKDKESTLLMKDSEMDDTWTSCRFILKARYLYYYVTGSSKKQRHHEYRVIPLKYSTVNWNDKAEDDGSWIFTLVTPIVTYILKAKHQVAMEEWVDAIARSRNSLGKKKAAKLTSQSFHPDDGLDAKLIVDRHSKERKSPKGQKRKEKPIDAVTDKPYLEIIKPTSTLGKKTRTYKITKTIVTIGRSSSNDIHISDSRLSREHARIDTVDNKLVFVDLGSKRGSKLNHHMVRGRQLLYPNDIIKVGRTLITVRVSHGGF